MADKGARNLIVLSRSGPSTRLATETISDLLEKGANIVTPCCDVSCLESLQQTLQDCAKAMPPIKGCINAAMLLQVRDVMFLIF